MKYLVCLFILVSSSAYAQGIYKWTDEYVKIHYWDSPPASVTQQEVTIDKAPSNSGKALPRLKIDDSGSSATSSDSPVSAKPEPEMSEEQAQDICNQAHRDLSKLNRSRNKARIRNPDGTSRQMNNEERKASREQANRNIKDYCK